MSDNRAQADYWTSPAGLKWLEHEHALDTAMAGMLEVMLDAADVAAGDRVLDIGCGTGASTIGAARRSVDGCARGVDISKALLDRAATRARDEGVRNASFELADAQTHRITGPAYDVLVSRIGMSFFSDTVSALRNLSTALRGGGRMAFVCWSAVDQNPWFRIPKQAAEARLGAAPATDPRAPGPTAFQDTVHVTGLMAQADLVEIEATRVEVWLTPPDGARGAARAASRVGPAARVIKARHGDDADAQAIEDSVARAFARYEREGEVRVPAAVNLFNRHGIRSLTGRPRARGGPSPRPIRFPLRRRAPVFLEDAGLAGRGPAASGSTSSFRRGGGAAPGSGCGRRWTAPGESGITDPDATDEDIMGILAQLFTWWNGQTIGTRLFTARKGTRVGEDAEGNVYYRNAGGDRRWVIYNGVADASRVAPEWHGWLHHTWQEPPTEAPPARKPWEKPHLPNLTGTGLAYRPKGSILAEHPVTPTDYEAWTPRQG